MRRSRLGRVLANLAASLLALGLAVGTVAAQTTRVDRIATPEYKGDGKLRVVVYLHSDAEVRDGVARIADLPQPFQLSARQVADGWELVLVAEVPVSEGDRRKDLAEAVQGKAAEGHVDITVESEADDGERRTIKFFPELLKTAEGRETILTLVMRRNPMLWAYTRVAHGDAHDEPSKVIRGNLRAYLLMVGFADWLLTINDKDFGARRQEIFEHVTKFVKEDARATGDGVSQVFAEQHGEMSRLAIAQYYHGFDEWLNGYAASPYRHQFVERCLNSPKGVPFVHNERYDLCVVDRTVRDYVNHLIDSGYFTLRYAYADVLTALDVGTYATSYDTFDHMMSHTLERYVDAYEIRSYKVALEYVVAIDKAFQHELSAVKKKDFTAGGGFRERFVREKLPTMYPWHDLKKK